MKFVKFSHVNGRELYVNIEKITYVMSGKIENETYIQIGGGSEVVTVKESIAQVIQLLTPDNSKGEINV
jgi:hypothetical protein